MTTIGTSLTIKGEVVSHEDVTIHGHVNGKISMHGGSLLVASSGNVQAEAHVHQLKIHGTFSGDIAATERVELANSAQVDGTLITPAIVVHDGAVFNGMIEVNRRTPVARKSESDAVGDNGPGGADPAVSPVF